MVLIAVAWIPVIKGASGLYNYLQSVQGYLAPPIFVVFFLGVFFKRMNAQGALWAMIVGFVMGIFRMLVDTPVSLGMYGLEKGYAPGSFLWICNNIYFQYFSVLITIVSAVVMVAVSYATSAAGLQEDRESDFWHLDSRRPPGDQSRLGLARHRRLGLRADLHPRGLPLLHRLALQGGRSGRHGRSGPTGGPLRSMTSTWSTVSTPLPTPPPISPAGLLRVLPASPARR